MSLPKFMPFNTIMIIQQLHHYMVFHVHIIAKNLSSYTVTVAYF